MLNIYLCKKYLSRSVNTKDEESSNWFDYYRSRRSRYAESEVDKQVKTNNEEAITVPTENDSTNNVSNITDNSLIPINPNANTNALRDPDVKPALQGSNMGSNRNVDNARRNTGVSARDTGEGFFPSKKNPEKVQSKM